MRTDSREPCSPVLRAGATVESATPSWSVIQLRIAAESSPSARITERSITVPPEECGRAKRLTRALIASVVTSPTLSALAIPGATERVAPAGSTL